jgi:hypothetical protein
MYPHIGYYTDLKVQTRAVELEGILGGAGVGRTNLSPKS